MMNLKYKVPEVDIYFGNTLKDVKISFRCRCGTTHEFPLDASGHYSGPIPCDICIIELQITPIIWRTLVESFLENQTQ